jgi:hypothetical protein
MLEVENNFNMHQVEVYSFYERQVLVHFAFYKVQNKRSEK